MQVGSRKFNPYMKYLVKGTLLFSKFLSIDDAAENTNSIFKASVQ